MNRVSMGIKKASDHDVAIFAALSVVFAGFLAIFIPCLMADLFEPRAIFVVWAGVVVVVFLDLVFLGAAFYYALVMRLEAAAEARQTPPPSSPTSEVSGERT